MKPKSKVITKSKTLDSPKYYIQTFGCQMNHKDSQNMAGVLETLGFTATADLKEAKVVIINTCSVRQASEDKVYGYGIKYKEMGYSRNSEGNPPKALQSRRASPQKALQSRRASPQKALESKRERPLTFVTGCMVGSAKGERSRYNLKYLQNKMPWVDYFLAPNEESTLPQILVKEKLVDDWSVKALGKINLEDYAKRDKGKTAFINISYGCDNFCTFCVVPYARGREVSRPQKEILLEINHAVLRGYDHIMLLGQNVNSWNLSPTQKLKTRKQIGKHPFAKLLQQVHDIEGVSKISFITSNPWDFTPELVKTLSLPKIERFLHLPVQSGSNKVLKEMNRRHTIEEYLELIEDIKTQVPEMKFGTDIIVGFPGETKKDFEQTVELFKKVKFKVAYISIYSARKGTPADQYLKDNVPRAEKKRRHKVLTEIFEKNK